jgi:surfactin synthase thioesterase subunit
MGAAIGASLQEPFAFYGHSMGALLAFELTRFSDPSYLLIGGNKILQK